MKAKVSTLTETLAAQEFIRLSGGDWRDNNMVLAVVSWLREQEHANPGYGKYNNVFQLLALPGAKSFKGQVNKSGRPRDLGIFKNLADEMKALAHFLTHSVDPSIRLILAAIRLKDPRPGYAAGQFLTALQASGFDQGATSAVTGKPGYVQDAVWAIYATFTGVTLPTVHAKPVKTTYRKFPAIPAALQPPPADSPFGDPYSAQTFYAARHPGAPKR